MSVAFAPTPPTLESVPTYQDQLLSTAAAVTSHAVNEPSVGILVIAVRPDADHHQVVAGGGTGVLRAAMSVAVAGGHDRLWNDLPDRDTIERNVSTLPEVVRAAADAADVVTVHAGSVRIEGRVECAAYWFETSAGVAALGDRRHSLELLAIAAERDIAQAATKAAEAETRRALDPVGTDQTVGRIFDADDSDLDPLTGLATPERFSAVLAEFEHDEAAIVVIDLDDFDAIDQSYGAETADRVVRVAADRLVAGVRGTDTVARLDNHRFAILLADAERSVAMQISKRLLGVVSQPLELDGGPASITATIALSHQAGLVDVNEMLELADCAVASGKRAQSGRLVLAD